MFKAGEVVLLDGFKIDELCAVWSLLDSLVLHAFSAELRDVRLWENFTALFVSYFDFLGMRVTDLWKPIVQVPSLLFSFSCFFRSTLLLRMLSTLKKSRTLRLFSFDEALCSEATSDLLMCACESGFVIKVQLELIIQCFDRDVVHRRLDHNS